MNKAAFVKSTALILLVCFAVSLVLYGRYVTAEVDMSGGLSPGNNYYSNNATPTFNFTPVSNASLSMNCTLFIDEVAYGSAEVNNNTPSAITANDTLAQNPHVWYVNCTDIEGIYSSGPRNITIDTTAPTILGVSFYPNMGWRKIGETVIMIIDAESAGYTAGAITVNGKSVTGFIDTNNSDYNVTYTVESGDTFIGDAAELPISVVLTDAAGNSNEAHVTSLGAGSSPGIDGVAPTCPSPTITEGANPEAQYASGTTIYYSNNSGDGNGTFYISIAASDAGSGISNVTFPTTFSAGSADSESPYNITYLWTSVDNSDYEPATITCYDNAGNSNTATFNVYPDNTQPTLTAVTLDDYYVNDAASITITSDGADAGSGISSCNAYWSTDTSYGSDIDLGDLGTDCDGTVNVPDGAGTFYVIVRAIDNVGYIPNPVASSAITVDNTAPVVSLDDNHADLIVRDADTVIITATFNESMTSAPTISIDVSMGSDADITAEVMNGSTTTWTYSWNVPSGHSDDTATVTVAGTDLAGNAYAGATNIIYTIDNTAPTVVITDDFVGATANGAVTFTFTFSENVTGFVVGDAVVTGGSKGVFTGADGAAVYTLVVTPTAATQSGTISVNVAAAVAKDAALNDNTIALEATQAYDTLAPGVVLASATANPVSGLIAVNVTFSESVADFIATDITVANGTVEKFAGSGLFYTFDVNPTDGASVAVTIDVVSGVAHDAAANDNTASNTLSYTSDTIASTLFYTENNTVTGNYSQNFINFSVSCSDENGLASINPVQLILSNSTNTSTFLLQQEGSSSVYWLNRENLADDIYEFYITCTDAANNTIFTANKTVRLDTVMPLFNFGWWDTGSWNQTANVSDPIRLPDYHDFSNGLDIFVSPNELELQFAVNVTDTTGSGISQVFANLSEFDNFPSNGTCHEILELELNEATGLYENNCTLDAFDSTVIEAYSGGNPVENFEVYFSAFDNSGNPAYTAYNTSGSSPAVPCLSEDSSCMPAMTVFNLHDMGVMGMDSPNVRFGSLTTDFSEVDDFNHVNMIIEIQVNLSGMMNNSMLPSNYLSLVLFNFSSLDFSSPAMSAKLSQLPAAIDFEILPPDSFGNSRVYVDTGFFEELDSNATIIISRLPFITEPEIIKDVDAGNVSSHSWVTNGFDSDFGVITGNMTFRVSGFSGYNVTDNETPIVEINPENGDTLNSNPVIINVTANGTGSRISNVIVSIDGVNNSWQANDFGCTAVPDGSEVYTCILQRTLSSGTHIISVTAFDYGGDEPGNYATESLSIIIDTTTPSVTLNSPNDMYTSSNTTVVLSFTPSDNIDNNISCALVLSPGGSSIYYVESNHSQTQTNTTVADGTYTWYVNCSDNGGNYYVSSTSTFTIDTVAPVVTLLTPINGVTLNFSTTPTHYFNVTDALCNTLNCIFRWGGLDPGEEDNFTITNGTRSDVGYIISMRNANITWNISCTDAAGNTGTSSNRWYRINDTTAPVISDALPSGEKASSTTSVTLSVTTDEGATCRYSTLNATYANMNDTFTDGVSEHTDTIPVSAGNSYTYYVRCADTNGNANLVSTVISFSIKASSSTGGSSSTASGAYGNMTANGTMEIIFLESTATLGRNSYFKFPIKNVWHKCTLISVGNGSVTFVVESTPQTVIVKEGESKSVDVTGDGNADVNITVVKIYLSGATVKFTPVSQPVSKPAPGTPPVVTPAQPPATPPAQTTPPPAKNESGAKNTTAPPKERIKLSPIFAYLISVAILVLIAFLVYGMISRKKEQY
jgi:hypothetical protein